MADYIRPTPRNPFLGGLADLLEASTSPERTQQMQGIMSMLGVPAVASTLNRMSYGAPLTSGAGGLGGTTRVLPDVLEAAMTVAPMAPAAGQLAKATAKTIAPTAAGMAEGYLQRQGLMPSITAYHAGPNLFNRFDVSRAPSTGSAYTQGAYAAASRREAQEKYLPRTGPDYEEKVMGLYKSAEKNKDYESMEVLESAMLSQLPSEMRQNFIKSGEYSPEFAKKAEGIINKLEKLPRDSYLYKLDIADEALPNYMLFDKPISEQPAAVQSFAKELGIAGNDMLGGDIVGKLRASGVKEAQIQEMMRKKGIPGLIYDSPDVPGSVNYVTYDPDLIKILEVNDMPASGLLNTIAP